jgi:hypothetical protein
MCWKAWEAIADETVFPLNKKCHNVGLRRQHLDAMGVGTCLQIMFPVCCLCIALCCSGVDLWCFGGLLPDISSIKDEISVIIMFWYDTVQGCRKFFPAAQGEAVLTDGGYKVFECTSTTHCLHLHLYTNYKEPIYKGKLYATLYTFHFRIWLSWNHHLMLTWLMFFFVECSNFSNSMSVISVCACFKFPLFKSFVFKCTALQRRLFLWGEGGGEFDVINCLRDCH